MLIACIFNHSEIGLHFSIFDGRSPVSSATTVSPVTAAASGITSSSSASSTTTSRIVPSVISVTATTAIKTSSSSRSITTSASTSASTSSATSSISLIAIALPSSSSSASVGRWYFIIHVRCIATFSATAVVIVVEPIVTTIVAGSFCGTLFCDTIVFVIVPTAAAASVAATALVIGRITATSGTTCCWWTRVRRELRGWNVISPSWRIFFSPHDQLRPPCQQHRRASFCSTTITNNP
mmetsp:Transcript_27820/g.50276  ORF Transcript_27820/g.50276 Transcript_27820/m.50276 type:complete len:238 (+) Transcript_27820:1312-2025(+)